MLLSREEAFNTYQTILDIKNKKMNIQTQYKLIKIKKAIEKEKELYTEQLFSCCEDYFEKNENGEFLTNQDGGYKIKEDKIKECSFIISELNKLKVQLPDIYFSIEELEELKLSFEELENLMEFIK